MAWNKESPVKPRSYMGALQRRQEALKPDRVESRLQEAKREIERLKRQEQNLIYLYRVGEYDEELLEIETKRLKEARRKAISRYEELSGEQLRISQLAEQVEDIETYCDCASRNLEKLDFDQKRLVLEALEIQVTVDGSKVMIRGFLPVGSPSFFPAFSTPKTV